MKIFKIISRYRDDESGAVTVDWVVLTAAIVGIAIAVLAVIRTGVESTGTKINNVLTSQLTNY